MRPHKPCARWNPRLFLLAVACCAIAGPALAFDAFITMQDGYFFDSATGKPWVPHGIAYQTWNRPLGVWQTFDQIDYDLDEFVKMGANSVRIDMVWKHIEEDADNQFKWENYDYFVDACEKRGLRIFALIGYQAEMLLQTLVDAGIGQVINRNPIRFLIRKCCKYAFF